MPLNYQPASWIKNLSDRFLSLTPRPSPAFGPSPPPSPAHGPSPPASFRAPPNAPIYAPPLDSPLLSENDPYSNASFDSALLPINPPGHNVHERVKNMNRMCCPNDNGSTCMYFDCTNNEYVCDVDPQGQASNCEQLACNRINSDVEGFNGNMDSPGTFTDRQNRRCRVVCDDPPQENRRYLEYISRRLIGKSLWEARRIYSNIRVVIANGRRLNVTKDFRPDRINVETRNNIITRILGYY